MKRIEIDKPAAAQPEATLAGAASQAAWNDAWSQQMSHTAEMYGKLFAAMRDEVAGFVQKRLEADMAVARDWSTCRSMTDVLDLQQKWLRSALDHYTEQGMKMAEICQRAVSEPARMAGETEVEAPKPAAERKTGTEHPVGSVPRAA